jgi:hypothetical protein
MKTLKQVLKDNPDHVKLIRGVLARIDKESIIDVVRNGADAGFGRFIYYKDTVAFFKKYKTDILNLAKQQAEDMDEDVLNMISNFNCLTSGQYPNRKPDYAQMEIGEAIFGNNYTDYGIIQNAMAWYALEEVCRMFEGE